MASDRRLIQVYKSAEKYLNKAVSKAVVDREIKYYLNRHNEIMTLNHVFRKMVESQKAKQGYMNFIADVEEMKTVLCGYNAKTVIKQYNSDWKQLFRAYKKEFGKHYKMDISNTRNAWVMYSKGVISCAEFLINFQTFKDFDDFVKSFIHNDLTVVALPLLLEKEIFGYGFPLACNLLNDLGYRKFAKPDTHIKDVFCELELAKSDKDYDVFKAVVRMAELVGEYPVKVDKIFWLIGSGKFQASEVPVKSRKKEFIALTRESH